MTVMRGTESLTVRKVNGNDSVTLLPVPPHFDTCVSYSTASSVHLQYNVRLKRNAKLDTIDDGRLQRRQQMLLHFINIRTLSSIASRPFSIKTKLTSQPLRTLGFGQTLSLEILGRVMAGNELLSPVFGNQCTRLTTLNLMRPFPRSPQPFPHSAPPFPHPHPLE